MVYLVDDDALVAQDISAILEQADYRVRHFITLDEFTAACAKKHPDVILMDMLFDGSLKNKSELRRVLNQIGYEAV